MKNLFSARLLALLCAIFLSFSLVGCQKTPKIEMTNRGYTNSKTGLVYHNASECYEPIRYFSDRIVATFDGLSLYAVSEENPDDYLYCPDFGVLFYRDGLSMPELSKDTLDQIYLCREETITIGMGYIEDQEEIAAIVKAYLEGESIEYPSIMDENANELRIKFRSPDYPEIYYSIIVIRYSEDYILGDTNYGDTFFYNRSERRFVPAGNLFEEYMNSYFAPPEEEEEATGENGNV